MLSNLLWNFSISVKERQVYGQRQIQYQRQEKH